MKMNIQHKRDVAFVYSVCLKKTNAQAHVKTHLCIARCVNNIIVKAKLLLLFFRRQNSTATASHRSKRIISLQYYTTKDTEHKKCPRLVFSSFCVVKRQTKKENI